MILKDPKGINFLFLPWKKREKKIQLVESLISLFNHALIRSNRGTSHTWHLERLQQRKEGPALVSPEVVASASR